MFSHLQVTHESVKVQHKKFHTLGSCIPLFDLSASLVLIFFVKMVLKCVLLCEIFICTSIYRHVIYKNISICKYIQIYKCI